MKQKAISVVLVASMLLSMSGCSLFDKDDKAVLAVAEEYASAVASADVDTIVSLSADGEETELTSYIGDCMDDKKMSDVYDAVLGSISYEIDSKSVVSSKKDASATVDVTYTIPDCEAIYKDVASSGGSLSDFAKAVEDDDGDNTIEISQTIKFVLDGKDWLVKDKNDKNLSEIYEFFGMVAVLSVTEKYAQAVVDLNPEGFKDLTTYDYSSEFDTFFYYYEEFGKDELKEVYEAIDATLSYEIEGSTLSVNGNKASIDVVFTEIAYDTVYNDVYNAGGNIDDYLEAIKNNNGANTYEITQSLMFELIDGKWLIDSDLYDLYTVYDYYDDVEYYTWPTSTNFEPITMAFFESTLSSTLGYTAKEYYEDLYCTAQYSGNDLKICIFQQYDLKHASEVYNESYYLRFQDILSKGAFSGNYDYAFNGTEGYIILDGYINYDQGWFNHNGYMYGGLFFTGDVFVVVLAYTDDYFAQYQVDTFLQAIGYPYP